MLNPEERAGSLEPGAAPADAVMTEAVQAQLLDLNRRFYEQFAAAFDETRDPRQPGLLRLAARLGLRPGGSLLDVGCGNGRLAQVLDTLTLPLHYLGVDASGGLLAAARRNTAGLHHVRAEFLQLDVTHPGWSRQLPAGRFDAITLLAVLHHLPGWPRRRDLLAALEPMLAADGLLAVSTWQFLNSARLRRKVLPWEVVGLQRDDVDAGDFLLDWKRGGTGYRYCHLVDEAELAQLAGNAGLCVRETFLADGPEDNLNLFALLVACSQDRRPEA